MKTSICMIASVLSLLLLSGCDAKNEAKTEEGAMNAPVSQSTLAKSEELDSKKVIEHAGSAETVALPPKNVTKEHVAQLKQQILNLTEVKTAEQLASCAVIAVGHKSCGGPKEYIAYSKELTDETELKQAVSAYYQADMQYQLENKMMSTCQVTPEQFPILLKGRCGLTLEPAATY